MVEPKVFAIALGVTLAMMPSAGCRMEPARATIGRLGEHARYVSIDRESRPVLASGSHLVVSGPIGAGCTLGLGYGVLGGERRVFRAAAIDQERSVELLHETVDASGGWQERWFSVPGGGYDRLDLEVDGDSSTGVWTRPLVQCRQHGAVSPNVVLVALDTLRADRLGAYGNDLGLTPAMDAIAETGTLFENVFAQFPSTFSSFGTIFTGLYPSTHGLLQETATTIGDDWMTLARIFADGGYRTVAFTEDGYVGSGGGFDRGFDQYNDGSHTLHGKRTQNAAGTFGRAIDWLTSRRTEAPFFLFVHTYETHAPYAPPAQVVERLQRKLGFRYNGPYASFPPNLMIRFNQREIAASIDDLKQLEILYDAAVIQADAQVARLSERLETLGLSGSTLLVVMADHGEEFVEHGLVGHSESLFTQVLHVPLILRMPGTTAAGARVVRPVGLIGLGPTITELAGLGTDRWPPSARSFADLARTGGTGDGENQASPVFSELTSRTIGCRPLPNGDHAPCRYGGVAIRDGRHSYIHSDVTSESHFFDVASDPGEASDLAPQSPPEMKRFQELEKTFRKALATSSAAYRKDVRGTLDAETRRQLEALGYLH